MQKLSTTELPEAVNRIITLGPGVYTLVDGSGLEDVTNIVTSTGTELVFAIPTDETASVPPAITGAGTVYKMGAGSIVLQCAAAMAYKPTGGIRVEEGELHLPRTTSTVEIKFGRVYVAEGATLFLAGDDAHENTRSIFDDLSGLGTVTNGWPKKQIIQQAQEKTSTFGGRIGGNIGNVWVYPEGRLNLTGVEGGLVWNGRWEFGKQAKVWARLQGDGAATNVFGGTMAESSGATYLDKYGAGTWALAGTLSFSGALAVNAGTLEILGNDQAWTWYKFVIKTVNSYYSGDSDSSRVNAEFALYDADGIRRTDAWSVSGSRDGKVWRELTNQTTNETSRFESGWYSDGTAFLAGAVRMQSAVPKGTVELPYAFTDMKDFKNFRSWTIQAAGVVDTKHRVTVSGSRLRLTAGALSIILR